MSLIRRRSSPNNGDNGQQSSPSDNMHKPLLADNDDDVKIRKQPTIYTYIIPLLFTFAFLLYQGVRLAKRIEINITIHKDRDGAPSLLRQTHSSYKIPSCAKEVFITLYSKSYSNIKDEDSCKGMLIRDDIILTTAECSKRNYTFDWHDWGALHHEPWTDTPQIILEAYPHDELNDKVNIANSPLGFLKVDSPPHYYYINRTAPRNRMFLSVQSKGRNGAKTIAMRCKDDKPIAHNFPTADGNMIPLRQLIDILPDDILWEHRDIDTAPTLTYKNEVWWSKAITLEDEEEIIKQLIEEHTGPIGSVSIPYAHSWERWTKQATGIMEAVDPRGHRLGGSSVSGGCMHDYYKLYTKEEPFSGAHYFDWFDFGEGNTILQDDEKCNKQTFNSHKVHYFSDEQRAFHKVYISKSEDGKKTILRYENNDELVPASEGEDASSGHLYMWDLDENFYVVDSRWNEKRFGVAKHTGLMAGQPALSAGEVYMNENGELWGINFSSGHYRPDIHSISIMYTWMKRKGFPTTSFHWVGSLSDGFTWTEKECYEWDWDKDTKIPGYSSAELMKSCLAVVNGPTWIKRTDVEAALSTDRGKGKRKKMKRRLTSTLA